MRLRYALIGLLALLLAAGAVTVTGIFLINGGIGSDFTPAYAEFTRCGQGMREGGDVKLRGVLVGRIGALLRNENSQCRIRMDLFTPDLDVIPANVGAQIRAKTIFGEKWVELLYPPDPVDQRIASGDEIGIDRTIDPIEVETILQVGLPLLEAIDPQHLSGALEALSDGFVGHEDAVIRSIERGIEALDPLNRNKELLREGLDQLATSSDVLADVDDDLLAALDNLDRFNRFTTANAALIDANLEKLPTLLRELDLLFETRFVDLTQLVDRGATVIGVLASRSGDLERLLDAVPAFSSGWIRNIGPPCPYRQLTTEPGKSPGDEVPGRCWRVHNIVSESQGAYEEPPRPVSNEDYRDIGVGRLDGVTKLLFAPALRAGGAV